MYDVAMPKLSDSMEVGKIIEWKVAEGDAVSEGDVLAEVESDKAVMELECFHQGTIASIRHGDGEEVPVGHTIATIAAPREEGEAKEQDEAASEGEGDEAKEASRAREEEEEEEEKEESGEERESETEEAESEPPDKDAAEEEPEEPEAADKKKKTEKGKKKSEEGKKKTKTAEKRTNEGKKKSDKGKKEQAEGKKKQEKTGRAAREGVRISPYARKLAGRWNVDVSVLEGTGVGGRIMARDVEEVAQAGKKRDEHAPPAEDEALPEIEVAEDEAEVTDATFRHKTQVRRVVAAKHAIPHFYMTASADVTALLGRKDALKEERGASVTHVVMHAICRALDEVPEINRSWDRGRVIKWKHVNLGVAIQTDDGLTVGVIPEAETLDLEGLAEKTRGLVDRARAGKLKAEDRRHPTFTISNLGMFGVEHFEPIINPPSAVTLGVSASLPTPVVRGEGIFVAKVMRLTASCDHRIIEGVAAARFLDALVGLLQNPDPLLDGD